MEAFIRETESIEQPVDDVVATKRVGNCAEFRAQRRSATLTTSETIRMDYSLERGFPQLIRTFRNLREKRVTAPEDSDGIELVAATAEIERLDFLDRVPDRDFLPDIPEGIAVTELHP